MAIKPRTGSENGSIFSSNEMACTSSLWGEWHSSAWLEVKRRRGHRCIARGGDAVVGVAVAVGGIASPMLGALGDGAGLASAIWVLAALAVVGLALSIGVAAIERRGA